MISTEDSSLLPNENVQDALTKYETFIHTILRPKQKKLLEEREHLIKKLDECTDQKFEIQFLQETGQTSAKTQVDLGSGFYVKARIPDTSVIFLNVGFGFFIQLTLTEALEFLDKKKGMLSKSIELLSFKIGKVSNDIQLTQVLLSQLLGLSVPESSREIF
ncbi:hypothetical protein HMI54_003665 [Coelomomyces lativittatus]|nr:hypothetical protein HMI54_003665 [Coelomomyces lativittatus]KAJ1513109.1 hypothetical protein HMI56_003029 [Coelomomyces lativittatus]